MKKNFIFVFIAISFIACRNIDMKLVKYESQKKFYEYSINKFNSIPLRNDSLNLVDSVGFKGFNEELAKLKYVYPYDKREESEMKLRASDMKLIIAYDGANKSILNSDYKGALNEIGKAERIYPNVIKYSDCLFLKAYANERLGNTDIAKKNYTDFIRLSGRKYSKFFRGYRDADKNDTSFIAERNYAFKYLHNQSAVIDTANFRRLAPKYYYGSLLPGYNMNPEDGIKKQLGMMQLGFYPDLGGGVAFGIQTYLRLNRNFGVNARLDYSKNISHYLLAFPVQLYKSALNEFGLKFSPRLSFIKIDSLPYGKRMYPIKKTIFNPGFRISAGAYIVPTLMIGAYYEYNLYNKTNRFNSGPMQIWFNNYYDISLYYNISKLINLKLGMKDNIPVVGMVWTGWEISLGLSPVTFFSETGIY